LGNTDFIKENKVKIYPNPVSNVLCISNIIEKTNVKILNVEGKIIKDIFISQNTDLNVEMLEKGLYFITFDNEQALKFIKE
jgi:hypothetical protein